MSSSRLHQRVLVIQDASMYLSVEGIRWAVHGLSLQPGDTIKLLRVVNTLKPAAANSSSCMSCKIPGVYGTSKLHSSRTIEKQEESISEEVSRNLDEYESSVGMKHILQLMKTLEIEFEADVEASPSMKELTIQAANNFRATSVIVDRKPRKDLKYIMDNLRCGILRTKQNGEVEYVRKLTASEFEEMPVQHDQRSQLLMRERQEILHDNSICSVCMNRRPIVTNVREFTYNELKYATNSFSEENQLSTNCELVYQGILSGGKKIVVRKVAPQTISGAEFKTRAQLLAKVRHENVAMLLGSFSEGPKWFLVYEYVCNSSLNLHLTSKSRELTWDRRIKIALGAAKGLQYLHKKSFYGGMRSNNILITHDYEALITSYGITENPYDLDRSSESRVLNALDYLAPEYDETVSFSTKTDVYSFGVVLLLLITGTKTLDQTHGQGLLRWARPLLSEKDYGELTDPAVGNSLDFHQLFWLIRLTEKCLDNNPYERYSMDQVVNGLTCISRGSSIIDYSPPESEIEAIARR